MWCSLSWPAFPASLTIFADSYKIIIVKRWERWVSQKGFLEGPQRSGGSSPISIIGHGSLVEAQLYYFSCICRLCISCARPLTCFPACTPLFLLYVNDHVKHTHLLVWLCIGATPTVVQDGGQTELMIWYVCASHIYTTWVILAAPNMLLWKSMAGHTVLPFIS